MMFQDNKHVATTHGNGHIQQDKMGRTTGPGSGVVFAAQIIGSVNPDNIQSANLALSFEMLVFQGFHVLVQIFSKLAVACACMMKGSFPLTELKKKCGRTQS